MNDTAPAISEKIIAQLPIPPKGNKVHYFSGSRLQGKVAPSGFGVRVTSTGARSFVWYHRVNGQPHLETLGRWHEQGGDLTVLRAIIAAQGRARGVRDGDDPRPLRTRRTEDGTKPTGQTVSDMLEEFVARYVEKDAQLRSADYVKDVIDRLIKPEIGKLDLSEIKRSHVARMLDTIADTNGLVMADRTLAIVRKAFNWWAARDDEFVVPIAKGMAKTKPKERARRRILSDDELRIVWRVADALRGPFGAFLQFILLTGARRSEAAEMTWDELDGSIWTLPAKRNKTKVDLVRPLSQQALTVLPAMIGDFVFSTDDGKTPISGFSKFKQALDKSVLDELRKQDPQAKQLPTWTLHDLRRTARTLMSRAGVHPDHAERCLGHVIGGVRETYDRWEFHDEKAKAYEALASLVERILNQPNGDVARLDEHRRRAAVG